MLRLVLLVLYLTASLTSAHSNVVGGFDPLGLNAPQPSSPPAPNTDQGSGWDPLG
jgi:hypothetical protein